MANRQDSRQPARPPLMSRINTTAILELISSAGLISRVDIARRLSLSGSTVTRLTAELIEAGLILTHPEPGESSGGRPPIMLSLNHRAATLVGVDIGGTVTTAALSDLGGHILTHRSIPSQNGISAPITPKDAIELIREIVKESQALGLPVRGIGIGAPSITRHRDGVVVLAPALNWENIPLAQMIEAELGLPAFIENDVNLAALGEHRYGAGKGTRHFVALLVGTGIGAGIIIDGELFRGARDAAGEIGYLIVERANLSGTYPGLGHFEQIAGGHGIATEMRKHLAANESAAADRWPADRSRITAREVFALANDDPFAAELVNRAIDYLAIAVANIACLFNPERIVIGGGVATGNPRMIPDISERLAGRIPDLPEIVPAELGDSAVLVGAVALARERTSGYAFVETVEAGDRAR